MTVDSENTAIAEAKQPELTPQIAAVFRDMEERLKDAPVYDLATLKAIHDYFEFESVGDTDLDAFLHAHIKKAIHKENT